MFGIQHVMTKTTSQTHDSRLYEICQHMYDKCLARVYKTKNKTPRKSSIHNCMHYLYMVCGMPENLPISSIAIPLKILRNYSALVKLNENEYDTHVYVKVLITKRAHWKFITFHEMTTVEVKLTVQKPIQYMHDARIVSLHCPQMS